MKNMRGKKVTLNIYRFGESKVAYEQTGIVVKQHTATDIRDDDTIEIRLEDGTVKHYPDSEYYFTVKEMV